MSEFDLNAMMKQAQAMQEEMLKAQEKARQQTVTATVGGGMVTATMTGGLELRSLKIEKSMVDPNDHAMLEDLIVAAINQAIQKAQELSAESMRAVAGGLNIPGLF